MKADKKKASMIFKNIADDGHINAMYAYFIMLFKGDGIEINKEKAMNYLEMAANKGHLNAIIHSLIFFTKEITLH